MKPSVISSANANSSGNSDPNAVNIPINHDLGPHYANAEANAGAYGSPRQQQQQPQIPAHFQQGFGFEPDMDLDMDMFPRGRLGRMHHDPFAGFGASHFGFPQFGSIGRRRVPAGADALNEDSDFFNRLPSEFRQYIPDGFGHRRAGSGSVPVHAQQQQMPPQQHFPYPSGSTPPNASSQPPTSKKVCDAAIQTEETAESGTKTPGTTLQDHVDHAAVGHNESLNQHGLRNTFDMGVKTNPEGEFSTSRAHSAPPPEQNQQNSSSQTRHKTPPQQAHFETQTCPQNPNNGNAYQKANYAPQHQSHPQQSHPPSAAGSAQPQTPGGTYIRTIPIFVEGRTEPIINAHKEIPNQNAQPPQPQQSKATHENHQENHQQAHQQQQHNRPAPLNANHQQPMAKEQENAGGPPPQTPHTLDSISKIQDIQRDVLDLMAKVEKFTGKRQDKEYAYLDEMLTRNLLKLDTIDTQGKDSIRLARKEAIKCIQASINVLEAKAEENAKNAQGGCGGAEKSSNPENDENNDTNKPENEPNESDNNESRPNEAIPLPPPNVDETSKTGGNQTNTDQNEKETQ